MSNVIGFPVYVSGFIGISSYTRLVSVISHVIGSAIVTHTASLNSLQLPLPFATATARACFVPTFHVFGIVVFCSVSTLFNSL